MSYPDSFNNQPINLDCPINVATNSLIDTFLYICPFVC